MLMDTVTAYKSGWMGQTAYLYTPLVWEQRGLDESELNLPSLAVESHHINGSSYEAEFKVGMIANKLENGNDVRIQGLVVDVDVHNRTSIMYLLPDSKGFQQRQPCGSRVIYTLTYHSSLTAYVYTPVVWECWDQQDSMVTNWYL